ncbi:hypothetical protein FRB96_008837 [Tulasnella sp. 330]|nr:hypothetical protein FRB96_008837 [Tulasnella sp. 330]KAG8882312.1 hypothetical protein FRB97_008420 [Tulasnella sp. 331]KAG8888250.1 hypothetical protein FRB98_008084 [Tulasnella sp. 332]
MASTTAEAKLLKLKVVDLKAILTKAGLSHSGVKHELVARIIAHKDALKAAGMEDSLPAPPAAAVIAPVQAALPEPDLENDDLSQYDVPPVSTVPAHPEQIPVKEKPAAPPPTPTVTIPSNQPKSAAQAQPPLAATTAPSGSAPAASAAAILEADAEKKRARAARFGLPVNDTKTSPPTAATTSSSTSKNLDTPAASNPAITKALADDEEKMKKRAARFGIPFVANAKPTLVPTPTPATPAATTGSATTSTSAVMNGKKEKGPAKAAPKPANKTPTVVTTDPAEEERKRKRAERFGTTAPAEKKAKTAA